MKHISYPFNIRTNVVSLAETCILRDFVCEMCYKDENWLSPNITNLVLMS